MNLIKTMKRKLSSLYGFHEINSLYSLGEVGYGIYGVSKYRIEPRSYLPQHDIYRPSMIRILPFPDRVAKIIYIFFNPSALRPIFLNIAMLALLIAITFFHSI